MLLGQGWALEPKEEDQPLVLNPLDEVLIAISLLRETLTSLPAPVVHVEPQDLSAVVQAVQGLAGPTSQLTAQDIAQAVQDVLLPAPVTESTPEWVERLLEALEKIDFRMKSTGVVSGGGSSSVTVQNQPGTTVAVSGAVTDLYQDSLTKRSFCATYTSSGDHDAITPDAGNRIRLLYVTFTPSSDNTSANLVKIGYGTTGGAISNELYRAYAAGHGAVFEGTADQSVIVNTATSEPVALTVHYEEIT